MGGRSRSLEGSHHVVRPHRGRDQLVPLNRQRCEAKVEGVRQYLLGNVVRRARGDDEIYIRMLLAQPLQHGWQKVGECRRPRPQKYAPGVAALMRTHGGERSISFRLNAFRVRDQVRSRGGWTDTFSDAFDQADAATAFELANLQAHGCERLSLRAAAEKLPSRTTSTKVRN
jgi:hypothetical protein